MKHEYSLYHRLKTKHKYSLEDWVKKYPHIGHVLFKQLTTLTDLNDMTLGAFQSLWMSIGSKQDGLLYWEFYKNRHDYFND